MPTKVKPEKITADFTGIEDRRGGGVHVPPGDYIVKVKDYELRHKKNEDGTFDKERPYLNWELTIVSPSEYKGKTLYHITSLVKESLWNLRNFLEDMGVTVPKKAVDVPLARLIGREVGVTVDDDEYNNQIRSKVQTTFSKSSAAEVAEVDADEDEVEEAATTASDDDEDTEELDLDDL
jgi:hypothetical protein